jgi:hypothetical protein
MGYSSVGNEALDGWSSSLGFVCWNGLWSRSRGSHAEEVARYTASSSIRMGLLHFRKLRLRLYMLVLKANFSRSVGRLGMERSSEQLQDSVASGSVVRHGGLR